MMVTFNVQANNRGIDGVSNLHLTDNPPFVTSMTQ